MHILFGNSLVIFRIRQERIYPASVYTGDTGHIFRFFHPAFNFKGIDAGLDQLRQELYGTHVLKA